jgi:transcriptional regulator with XRE-family HTH domain
MNAKIVQFFKNIIESKGVKYTFVAEKSGIEYQRLMRIFNQNATISGSELICLSRVLEVEHSALMELLDSVA